MRGVEFSRAREQMKFYIRHSMEGRVRLRIEALRFNAAAASGCTDALAAIDGVTAVRWSAAAASMVVSFSIEGARALIYAAVSSASIRECEDRGANRENARPELTELDREQQALGTAAVAAGIAMFGGPLSIVALPLLIWNAVPTWRSAWRVVKQERRLNVDFLDGMAIAIGLLQFDLVTTAVMIGLIRLGNWIREHTAGRSKRAIGDLLDYEGRAAWLMVNGKVARVPVKSLAAGNRIVIYPGELIPVDGTVLSGAAMVDQKTITGESLPVRVARGDSVFAATVLREGKLIVEATRVGSETTAAQIVQAVEAAPIGETRIQNYAEKFADRLVAPQLALNCGLFLMTGNVNRFLSMTIIDYGTGMRVAAPTAVLASITHAARQGIVIRSGSHVEKLASSDTIVFDKTGTLTMGCPEIVDVFSYRPRDFPQDRILGLAAAAEARLKHPVAHALTAKAEERRITIPERSESHYEIGMGVSARVNGFQVHVGNERFFRTRSIPFANASRDLHNISSAGCSPLLVAADDDLIGVIPYADRVRPESAKVLKALHDSDVSRRMVMLTGDNPVVARAVASQVGIREFVAEMMPHQKAKVVQQLQAEGRTVVMVGDGINDSPALAYADVGVAMKNGADVAQESADVILMEDNLWKLVQAFEISRQSMSLIRQNYAIIAGLNTLALLMALPAGLVSPNATALISNGSAILAAINAIRPILRY